MGMSIGRAVMLALCLAPVFAQGAEPVQPLRVGLIAPLTGASSDFGNSMRIGAEMAVKEINEVGGFQGRPLELVVRDDQATPDVGRRVAEELVKSSKVAYTIGFCNTGVAMKSLDVFQSNKHVLMVPCSQGSAVTTSHPLKDSYVFRLAPSDDMNAAFLVKEIVKRRKISKIAILADTTGYGNGGVTDLTSELAELQLKPAFVGRFELGVTDLTELLRSARKAGAEALVVYAVGLEQAVAVKGRAEIGWKVPYFAPWTLSFRSTLEHAGAEALEGTMMAQSIILDAANERRTSFIARYVKFSKEGHIGSLMAAAQAYDAVHLVLRAVFQTRGDVSGPALKAALEDLHDAYRGVVTTYKQPYSATDHEAFSQNMVWLGVWRRGEIQFFHREDASLSAQMRRKDAPKNATEPH